MRVVYIYVHYSVKVLGSQKKLFTFMFMFYVCKSAFVSYLITSLKVTPVFSVTMNSMHLLNSSTSTPYSANQ